MLQRYKLGANILAFNEINCSRLISYTKKICYKKNAPAWSQGI